MFFSQVNTFLETCVHVFTIHHDGRDVNSDHVIREVLLRCRYSVAQYAQD